MSDNLTRQQRAVAMRRVKAQDTSAEIAVRQLLRRIGETGYRLHRKELPGKPDIVFIRRKLIIFVHGCFWHGHDCARGSRVPKTNYAYWTEKIAKNKARDKAAQALLEKNGWKIMIVWECEIKDQTMLSEKLLQFLNSHSPAIPPPWSHPG